VKIRIVKLPPTTDLRRLEVNPDGLTVGGVYDLSVNAASYLVVMGFAEFDGPPLAHLNKPGH
jgi:hypothetical protein